MRRLRTVLAVIALLLPLGLRAGEGLWLIQDLNSALEKKMRERGLKMHARAIYDMDSPGAGVADAVVSLGGRYSGAFVSDKGLLLTSGIPAEDFIGRLGDVGKDLLRDGFWAASEQHEIPVPGEKVYSLRRVYDVTKELHSLESQLGNREEAAHRLELAYSEATKLSCFAHVYWEGEQSYVLAYKIYDDVRLVAAPPAKCFYSLYRVFENGKPAVTSKSLLVSVEGAEKGAFTAALGYPDGTSRNISSIEYRYQNVLTRPLSSEMGRARLRILDKWIEEDPSVKSKYSGRVARLRESLEDDAASLAIEKDRGLQQIKTSKDEEIQARVDKDPSLQGMWRNLLEGLENSYEKILPGERDIILRNETLVDGTFVAGYLIRAASAANIKEATDILFAANRETDPRVEKELLAQALSEFYTNLDMSYFGPYQRWIQRRFGYNWSEAADYLWGMSLVSQPSMTAELESIDDLTGDSLLKFLTDSPLVLYDINDGHASKLKDAKKFSSEYLKARYWAGVRNNEPEYPDADATLRLAFGAADGTVTPVTTLLEGLGQGASARWKAALQKDFWGRWGFRVNGKRHKMATTFMTDIDFADGMEGSPVIDAQGRLIGIVSGGTQSSVVGKRAYLEGSSGSVCTDIRFILWTLDRYAGQKRILKEFEID